MKIRDLDKADPRRYIKQATQEHLARKASLQGPGWHGLLTHEMDHRKLELECGEGLTRMDRMSQFNRMLSEGNEVRISTLQNGRITKIICRRNPEYQYVVEQEERDEWDDVPNPEDVYERDDVERVSLKREIPRDKYDLIFNVTTLIQEVRRVASTKDYQSLSEKEKENLLERMTDELTYSADWFPALPDKRFHSARTREIIHEIQTSPTPLTKHQVLSLMKGTLEDKRPQLIEDLRVKAQGITGPRKAALLKQIEDIKKSRKEDIRRMKIIPSAKMRARIQRLADLQEAANHERNPKKRGELVREFRSIAEEPISLRIREKGAPPLGSDRQHIWDAWVMREIQEKGAVKLQSWQFQRKYSGVLLGRMKRQEISREEAISLLQEKMEKIYGVKGAQLIIPR